MSEHTPGLYGFKFNHSGEDDRTLLDNPVLVVDSDGQEFLLRLVGGHLEIQHRNSGARRLAVLPRVSNVVEICTLDDPS